MSIHPKDVLFFAGGACLQRFGVPVMRQTRAQDAAATFTRSGSVGSFVGKDGVLRSASANRLRVDWIDTDGDGILDTPTLLLEAARTNVVSDDDLSAWGTSGTPVVTGSVDDPAGGTGAYTVADDDGAATESLLQTETFTGDAVKSVVVVVRENTMPASGIQLLQVWDATAGASRLALEVSGWSVGEPSVSATTGTLLGKRYIGNGYWAIYAQTTSVTAANTNQLQITPAFTATETGSIDVYRFNAYDALFPSYSILDAGETRNADTFYADFLHNQQPLTIYVKMRERGTALIGGTHQGVVHIGGATASADPRLVLYHDSGGSSGLYTLLFDNATAEVTVGATGTAATYGDIVELRAVLDANEDGDGDLIVGQSVNGAAESTATASGPSGGLGTTFNDTRIYIGSLGSGNQGLNAFESVKVVRDVQTMADMRALFAYDTAAAA